MTAPDKPAIRARLAAATPGPWVTHEMSRVFVGNKADGRRHGLWEIVHMSEDLDGLIDEAKSRIRNNADLIAHAPTDLAALLAENERQAAVIAKVTELADEWMSDAERDDGPECEDSMACSVCVKAEQSIRLRAAITTTQETRP